MMPIDGTRPRVPWQKMPYDGVPTTLAGVLALIANIDEFNGGGLVAANSAEWCSSRDLWRDCEYESGEADEPTCSAAWCMLENVGIALRAIAAGRRS